MEGRRNGKSGAASAAATGISTREQKSRIHHKKRWTRQSWESERIQVSRWYLKCHRLIWAQTRECARTELFSGSSGVESSRQCQEGHCWTPSETPSSRRGHFQQSGQSVPTEWIFPQWAGSVDQSRPVDAMTCKTKDTEKPALFSQEEGELVEGQCGHWKWRHRQKSFLLVETSLHSRNSHFRSPGWRPEVQSDTGASGGTETHLKHELAR